MNMRATIVRATKTIMAALLATGLVGLSASMAGAATTRSTTPGAVRSVHAKIQGSRIVVSWAKPTKTGNGGALSYLVSGRQKGESCHSALTSCTMSAPKNGGSLSFDVIASNKIGTGPASAWSNIVVLPTSTPVVTPPSGAAVYSVTFNANGGTGTMGAETSSSAEAITTNSFTRSGYNFTGWNSAADDSGSAYANGATYGFSSSITLYAQWSTVASAPVITVQPTDQVAAPGQVATFNAGATGVPSPSIQWAQSTDQGSTWSAISGATSSSYGLSSSWGMNGVELRAVFTNSAGSTTSQSASFTYLESSTNWAGYAEYGSTFNSVAGSWVVPTVTCGAGSNLQSVQWVGIDGEGSSTVEQIGTRTGCSNGVATYNAWYEMYGDAAINGGYAVSISTGTYPLSPGDSVSASVSYTLGSWRLSISDPTAGWFFSIPINEPSSAPLQASAEWIVESPEVCSPTCALSAPAQTTSVTFTNATASFNGTGGGIGDTLTIAIELSTGSSTYVTPGPLNATGSSFTNVT